MPDIRHLSRAPIVEALVNFQANATRLWKAEEVSPALTARWPEHSDVQELRPVKIEMTVTPEGQMPPQVFTAAETEGFIFRSQTQPTVHQVRRDGYTFSRLAPYEEWPYLEQGALAGWAEYQAVLQPEPLHAVAVRFINRLEFPVEGFRLARYFTMAPSCPAGLEWVSDTFMHHTSYAVPGSPCLVRVNFGSAFDLAPSNPLAFLLDIEVFLKEPLSDSKSDLRKILEEMHALKNRAFFHLLTAEAIERYL